MTWPSKKVRRTTPSLALKNHSRLLTITDEMTSPSTYSVASRLSWAATRASGSCPSRTRRPAFSAWRTPFTAGTMAASDATAGTPRTTAHSTAAVSPTLSEAQKP